MSYATSATAQGIPLLEKKITLQFNNEPTGAVLNSISKSAGFNFSYNPAVVDAEKLISGNYINKPVREILNALFQGRYDYKEKKGYVILQKVKQPVSTVQKPENIVLNGYIRDASGQPISWVSVYDKASLTSTVSNDYGYYRISFPQKHLPLNLYFSKQGYRDTIFSINSKTEPYQNIVLQLSPAADPVVNYDSLAQVAESTVETFFHGLQQDPNAINISDTLYRTYQVSVLPNIGTNMKLSANVVNDYSFNLLSGISMGVQKAELGGLCNLNKSDVKYCQIAGFTNLTGGSNIGLQIAGFNNMVRRNLGGVQIGGFANTVMDTVIGLQIAGFCNVAGKSLNGVQISGMGNLVLDTLRGIQIGFFNYAYRMQGVQIGFFNYSHTAKGVPFGFISYVDSGYHKIEVSADEVMPVNIAFRTGLNSFHNILAAGISPFEGDSLPLWSFGYGVGSSVKLGRTTLLDFDITSSQIVKGDSINKINLLNKAYLGIDQKIAKKMSIAFGVTLNGQLTQADYNIYPEIFSWYEPNIIYDETFPDENLRLKMWVGAKIALRFL